MASIGKLISEDGVASLVEQGAGLPMVLAESM